jgi:murein DD-endopeptidase MepM/ murein hydrolase activator NlpD
VSPRPPATTSTSPSPSPSAAAPALAKTEAARPPPAYRIDVDRLIAASSLAALIDARARLARTELAALEDRVSTLMAARADAESDRAAFRSLIDSRGRLRDRLLRDALRAVAQGSPVGGGTEEARLALEDQTALQASADARVDQLSTDATDLDSALASVGVKEAELRRLDARSKTLLAVSPGGGGQLAVLRDLADEASAVAASIAQLLRGSGGSAEAPLSWDWPLRGTVTQLFGPSALGLEPSVSYHGILFAHFHDAIDIAAPLGTVVTAPANARVLFVGHLPDGAMVVVLQHDDGFVSLAAHLDDAFAPPPVRTGDRVARGGVIGYVGMTGVTTGPHVHFAVHFGGEPVDPLAILPSGR